MAQHSHYVLARVDTTDDHEGRIEASTFLGRDHVFRSISEIGVTTVYADFDVVTLIRCQNTRCQVTPALRVNNKISTTAPIPSR